MAPYHPGSCRIHLIDLSPVNSLLGVYSLLPAVLLPAPPPFHFPQTHTAPSITLQLSTQHATTCCISFHHYFFLPYSALCLILLVSWSWFMHVDTYLCVISGNHRSSYSRSPAGASSGCCALPQGSPWFALLPFSTLASSPFSPPFSPTGAP